MTKKGIKPDTVQVPAAAVRDFLRQTSQLPEWDTKFIRAVLALDAGKTSEVLEWMQLLGHVEPVSSKKATWRNTQAGNALAGVKPGKPVKRETIEKALNALPERIRIVNTSPQHAYAVSEAALFGPYYTTDADVRAADVAVTLVPKRSKVPVSNTPEAQMARKGIVRLLKGKGRGLAVFEVEDWMTKQPHRVMFKTASS